MTGEYGQPAGPPAGDSDGDVRGDAGGAASGDAVVDRDLIECVLAEDLRREQLEHVLDRLADTLA